MKTKVILMAALLGTAALSANAGVSFGISIGLPVIVSTPVVYAPAPAPVIVVQTVPAGPDVNYVWVPGCWSYRPNGWVWISGGWHYPQAHIDRGHNRGHDRDRGNRDRDRGHDHDRGGYHH